jgi:hypothetical protein
MLEFIQTYSAELISTGTILMALGYPMAKRIVSDKNMVAIFDKAKASIVESNNIKVDIKGSLANFNDRINSLQKVTIEQMQEFERVILEFQEGELYQKMLIGAEQVEKINEVLAQKDETISMLGMTLKDLTRDIQEIKNTLKG